MHYLDFAATSARRPDSVARAVFNFLTENGASPGRGAHGAAAEAGRIAFRCRRRIAQLLSLPGDPGRVAFTLNATHALNTALHGLLGTGDAVVITPFDHNAVLRPAFHLSRTRGVEVRMARGAPDGTLDLEHLRTLLAGAKLLVVNEVSNVLGTRLPLSEMAAMAHREGALVLVDMAQSAGHLPSTPAAEGADLAALAGHKGLLGPQGTGALWIREGIEIEPFLTGGTGGESTSREMPAVLPDRLEAGTPNIPGIAGLLAGIEFILSEGVDALHERGIQLKSRLRAGFEGIPGVRILSPAAPDGGGLVTIVAESVDPSTLGLRLQEEWGVLTRTGLHCAPEVHRLIGTLETGAVRFSLGWSSTEDDVDRAVDGVRAVVRGSRS